MSGRAHTPPSREPAEHHTPEQVKAMAMNRLKAKAKVQERDRATRASALQPGSAANSHAKRPLVPIPAGSHSPTRAGQPRGGATASTSMLPAGGLTSHNHFQRDDPNKPLRNMIPEYVDYNLDKMTNSHGGYLVDETDAKALRDKERIEKHKKERLEVMLKQGLLHEQAFSADMSLNPKCMHCGSISLDVQYRVVFGVLVCKACKEARPDDYSLLTKTECKEDYLLTDPELRDAELLPHLLKPNPHRPTYSNMMLFLRIQVETYAFSDQKWGSPEALDVEFAKRETEKAAKKGKKFAKKLRELRQGTKTNVWHRRVEGEHTHAFRLEQRADGVEVQRCDECEFEVEVETF